MGFDWKDIGERALATFIQTVFAYLVTSWTGVITADQVKGALFAGVAAAASLVWNIIKQYYGIRQMRKKAA